MTNSVNDLIDFRMQLLARTLEDDDEKKSSVQMTVRVPESLKVKLDVMSDFVGGTRNSILVDLLEVACDEAIERINDNPYIEQLRINGKTIHEAIDAAMKGDVSHPGLADADHESEMAYARVSKGQKNK